MRISTQQVFLSNIDNINRVNEQIFDTQQQLATGRRVQQPSDDPLASAQIQAFNREIARTEQFEGNIEVAERRLELEEATLDQINVQTIRLRELALQARNSTLTAVDRQAVASEVDEILSSIEGLVNTVDVQGEYLFSGNRGLTEAYTFDAATDRYVFNGDEGRRFLQVGPSNRVASTDSGFELFERVAPVPGYVEANVTQTTAVIGEVDIEGGRAEEFGNFITANGPLTVTVAGGLLTVTDEDGQFVTAESPAVSLDNYDLSTNPNTPNIRIAGVDIEISAATDGTASLDVFDRHNILNTALDLSNALKEFDGSSTTERDRFNQKVDFVLENLSGIEELNISARASIGGRINALDQQSAVNADYILFTQEALSDFQDLDYAEAISRFQLQQTVLEASFASFSQVQDLNLFNFIN